MDKFYKKYKIKAESSENRYLCSLYLEIVRIIGCVLFERKLSFFVYLTIILRRHFIIMKKIANFLLSAYGWKVIDHVGYIAKAVICVAPHTSNWDFIIGKLAYWSLGRQASFLMKKNWFFPPLGSILRAMGGIPVDRTKRGALTDNLAREFMHRQELQIAITPEGTRKLSTEWKKGFYFVAQKAQVPILLAAIDYKRKCVELRELFYPTGDVDGDIQRIRARFTSSMAKYPDQFLSI